MLEAAGFFEVFIGYITILRLITSQFFTFLLKVIL
jgi:hypothetical protein